MARLSPVPVSRSKAACRAALLKACRVTDAIVDTDRDGVPIESVCVDVDDAAACMAEREARLMAELGAAGARNARSKVREAKLREALKSAELILGECGQDYNHPHFTDRHGTGPRINGALRLVRAALAAAQDKP